MKIAYYKPSRRALTLTLLLLATLALLVITGLGVFRLTLHGDWNAGSDASGRLFSLALRGSSVFDPVAAEPFGRLFWLGRVVTLALALLLPWLTIVPGTLLAGASAGLIGWLHYRLAEAGSPIPVEFELLIVGVLTGVWVLVSWARELRDRQRFSMLLGQYVPPELAAAFSRHPETMGLSGEMREVSVLFCDVVGFSAVSERLAPSEVADWLNGFFECVSRVVVRHRGTIDKLMGDSVMAVWGAPARSRTHAFDALSAALDMVRELGALNERYQAQGLPELTAGIGLSSGQVNVGPLGSEFRMDYTVVGDTVNVAQRLEKQTRKYRVPIIVSDSTAEALPDMLFRELDTAAIKGRATPVTLFAPLGPRHAADARTRELHDLHRDAIEASKNGEWDVARAAFERLRDEFGPESMYSLYLRGIEQASR